MACKDGYPEDLCRLAEKLLLGFRSYFSRTGVLNSDGRKLFEGIVKRLLDEHPEHRRIVARARREPTLENVLRVVELFYEGDPRALVETALGCRGPYEYPPPGGRPWPRPG